MMLLARAQQVAHSRLEDSGVGAEAERVDATGRLQTKVDKAARIAVCVGSDLCACDIDDDTLSEQVKFWRQVRRGTVDLREL